MTKRTHPRRDGQILLLGGVLVGACVATAHFAPSTFATAALQMQVLTALGGGLLGTAVPGLIGLEFRGVRAIGAGTFVVLFFLLAPKPSAAPPVVHAAPRPQADTPPPRPAQSGAGAVHQNSPHVQGNHNRVDVQYDQRGGDDLNTDGAR
jgi:hypothetical protein